jgi:hypothetical protein
MNLLVDFNGCRTLPVNMILAVVMDVKSHWMKVKVVYLSAGKQM